jgi:hypothetical protein
MTLPIRHFPQSFAKLPSSPKQASQKLPETDPADGRQDEWVQMTCIKIETVISMHWHKGCLLLSGDFEALA